MQGAVGTVDLQVPQDRNGTWPGHGAEGDPQDQPCADMIITLSANGMTTRDMAERTLNPSGECVSLDDREQHRRHQRAD